MIARAHLWMLAVLLPLAGCAAPTATVVYSLQGLECSSCLKSVTSTLGETEGVVAAKSDKHRVEVAVTYRMDANSPESLDALVAEQGYLWKREAGAGSWAPEIEFPASMDVKKISAEGEEVDIEAHLAMGKVTIVDFYASWCGPCRVMTHTIKKLMATRDDLALRKINIVDWDRPVVAQHLGGVTNIPHVRIYGKDGAQVAAITGVKKEELSAAIAQAAGPPPAPPDAVESDAP